MWDPMPAAGKCNYSNTGLKLKTFNGGAVGRSLLIYLCDPTRAFYYWGYQNKVTERESSSIEMRAHYYDWIGLDVILDRRIIEMWSNVSVIQTF